MSPRLHRCPSTELRVRNIPITRPDGGEHRHPGLLRGRLPGAERQPRHLRARPQSHSLLNRHPRRSSKKKLGVGNKTTIRQVLWAWEQVGRNRFVTQSARWLRMEWSGGKGGNGGMCCTMFCEEIRDKLDRSEHV